ncbi:MAG: TonB-dependent receptor [Acidobacteria bacterium]|nr:TonB-dependent receptor [Acidobacteriota bacterium]
MMKRSALLTIVVLSICQFLYSQANGSFSGTVTDKTGSVIAGATVKVTSEATGISRDAKTDASGHYSVPLLPVSDYTVRVDSQGFQAAEQRNVKLQIDEHRELDFSLAPASVSQTVDVSAEEVAVQTTNPTLGQVITEEQVAQLPLNGRNFVQLATLTPGTTQETNPNSFFNGGPSSEVSTRGSFSLSVGGSRASATDWLLDGNDNNELTAGGIAIIPSIDAIQEFKVLTYNYSAQYGTRAGPTVILSTKAGGNKFHGSLFEFLRNTSFDAKSFFAQKVEKFNLNQFGGSLGGPIVKDKTFFFIDYEAKRSRQGNNFLGIVPTQEMRNGDFSHTITGADNPIGYIHNPFVTGADNTNFQCDGEGSPIPGNADGSQAPGVDCNKIPGNLLDPAAAQMLASTDFYPLPNTDPAVSNGNNFINAPSRKVDEGKFDIRLDHNFSSKDSLFARFSYDQATVFIPGGSPGFAEANAFGSTQDIDNHGRNVSLSETHIFSGNSINQFSAGYNRIFNHIRSKGSGTCISEQLGIPGANLGGISCGLTSMIIGGGFWSLGDRGFAPFQGGTNVFTIADSFDMIRGKHNIKIGGELRINQLNVATNAFQDGFLVFTNAWAGDNMANFALGLPDLALHDQTFKGSTTGRRWKLFRPYIQDDWRVTNNLTLNLGLAWALVTPVTEAQNRQANFDFATGKFLIPGQGSDSRVGVQWDKRAFEPRIGLAWKPFGSNKTAVRAGYAIFHDSSWNQGGQGLWENPPFFAESNFAAFFPDACPFELAACHQTFDLAATGKGISPSALCPAETCASGFPIISQPTDPADFGGNIFSQNLDFKMGTVQQYNFNVERQLPGDIVLTVGYAGSKSTHILVDGQNLNVKSPSACDPGDPTFDPNYKLGCGLGNTVAYPQFGNIQNINDIGSARYDSLQIKAETKSARHGLYALLSYTYARAFDSGFSDGLGTGTGATYFPLPGTSKGDWALSQIHLNHNFSASVIYDLPFGKGKEFGNSWSTPVDAVLGNWQINVIERITSGFPIFITTSNNTTGVSFANNGNNSIRPNQTCSGKIGNPTPAKWFNTDCFEDPAPGQLGTAGRSPLYGPGFVNTDFSVVKQFTLLRERGVNLEFRAEFFNLFNHAQFFQPDSDLASGTFGKISQTVNNARLTQFALKLHF